MSASARERFLREAHGTATGCTSLAFAAGQRHRGHGSTYDWLLELVPEECASLLDLGCGDGWLLSLVCERHPEPSVIGVDLSGQELRILDRRGIGAAPLLARAQALPLAKESIDLVLSHMALPLMEEPARVLDEIHRVLRPGGSLGAVIGGGPKVGDPFELFIDLLLEQLGERIRNLPRLSEASYRRSEELAALFTEGERGFESVDIEGDYVDCGADFDTLWPRLVTVYEAFRLGPEELQTLRSRYRHALGELASAAHIPCTMAVRRLVARKRR